MNTIQKFLSAIDFAITDPSVPMSFRIFTLLLVIIGFLVVVGWLALPFAVLGVSASLRRINAHLATLADAQHGLLQANVQLDAVAARLRELTQMNSHLETLNSRLKEMLTANTRLGEIADRMSELKHMEGQLQAIVDRMERVLHQPRKG
ncbi:MAG: hypothetical protein V1873_07585 [Verrucomicrobiota bacterium]